MPHFFFMYKHKAMFIKDINNRTYSLSESYVHKQAGQIIALIKYIQKEKIVMFSESSSKARIDLKRV